MYECLLPYARTFLSGQRYFGDNCECVNSRCLSAGIECNNRGICTCIDGCSCNTSSITGMRHTGLFCQCNTEDCLTPECRTNPSDPTCSICSGAGTCVCTSTGSQCNCQPQFLGDQCQINLEGQRTCIADSERVRLSERHKLELDRRHCLPVWSCVILVMYQVPV